MGSMKVTYLLRGALGSDNTLPRRMTTECLVEDDWFDEDSNCGIFYSAG